MTRDSGASEQLPPHPRFCPIFSPMGDVDDDDVYEDGDDNDDDDGGDNNVKEGIKNGF